MLLILLILLLLLVHQFAGLCIQQKQMGNICPGRPVQLPGPRNKRVPEAFVGTPVMALLLYSDKPFFRDCRIQQGPGVFLQAWPRSGSEGRARMQEGWGAGIRDTRPHPGHLRAGLQGIPVFLLSRAQVSPQLRYCPLKSNAILLPVKTQLRLQGFGRGGVFTFPQGGLPLGDRSAFSSLTGLRACSAEAGFLSFRSVLCRQ